MSDDKLVARDCAYRALRGHAESRSLRIVDRVDELAAQLDGRDRSLARELALGVLRWQRLYDHLAAAFLRPGRQPDSLLWVLRLLAHQLFALDRVPPHAAVDGTVELLRRHGEQRLLGVANAVGRRLSSMRLRERRCAPGPHGRLAEGDLPDDLGLRWSLPDSLLRRLQPALPVAYEPVLAALNQPPPLCTRSRPGYEDDVAAGADLLRREGAWCWWRRSEDALRGPVADGIAVVQDRGQGRLLELLDQLPLGRACDLCAAPGGKSLALIDRGWQVVAGDDSLGKLAELRRALDRAVVFGHDARRPALAPACADLVVLDVPCSNSAVLARRPEARWRIDERELSSLQRLQEQILRSALDLLRPGGHLLYSTCSLLPMENAALVRRAGLQVIAEQMVWPDAWQMGGYAALCW